MHISSSLTKKWVDSAPCCPAASGSDGRRGSWRETRTSADQTSGHRGHRWRNAAQERRCNSQSGHVSVGPQWWDAASLTLTPTPTRTSGQSHSVFCVSFAALRHIILTSGTLLKDDVHKVTALIHSVTGEGNCWMTEKNIYYYYSSKPILISQILICLYRLIISTKKWKKKWLIVDGVSYKKCHSVHTILLSPQRLCDVVLPLCVRLQQQQSSSNGACEPAGAISGQYGSALTRRELYRLRFYSRMKIFIS